MIGKRAQYAIGAAVGSLTVVILTLFGVPWIAIIAGVVASWLVWKLYFEPEDPGSVGRGGVGR